MCPHCGKLIEKEIDTQIPEQLISMEFKDAWERWTQHRKELKKKMTPSMTKAALKKLATFGIIESIAIIDYTIEKGWQGLAYEKGNTYGANGNTSGMGRRSSDKVEDCRKEGINIPVFKFNV